MNDPFKMLCSVLLSLLLASGGSALASAVRNDTQEWRFRVYLDDFEIGYHDFTVTNFGPDQEVRTEAAFDVKFLFFNAFKYRHYNTERWSGNCLEGIRSETRVNGDRYSVIGSARESDFVVTSALDDKKDRSTLPECVMTFAYWSPDFLEQPRLLNSQTGDYIPVESELVGEDLLSVRGAVVPTYRYRLTGDSIDIELWYSPDREWLALESLTEGGRRLRYELI